MCPLRFILVFFSALLAGYLAWRTANASPEPGFNLVDSEDDTDNDKKHKQEQHKVFKGIQNGFWVFVDMASGRYLFKNLKKH